MTSRLWLTEHYRRMREGPTWWLGNEGYSARYVAFHLELAFRTLAFARRHGHRELVAEVEEFLRISACALALVATPALHTVAAGARCVFPTDKRRDAQLHDLLTARKLRYTWLENVAADKTPNPVPQEAREALLAWVRHRMRSAVLETLLSRLRTGDRFESIYFSGGGFVHFAPEGLSSYSDAQLGAVWHPSPEVEHYLNPGLDDPGKTQYGERGRAGVDLDRVPGRLWAELPAKGWRREVALPAGEITHVIVVDREGGRFEDVGATQPGPVPPPPPPPPNRRKRRWCLFAEAES